VVVPNRERFDVLLVRAVVSRGVRWVERRARPVDFPSEKLIAWYVAGLIAAGTPGIPPLE
jgi:hypothetical protein